MFFNVLGKENNLFFCLSYFIGNSSSLTAAEVDLNGMVSDANGHYYHYSGSLTTPNCSEVVTWNVMQKSIYVSKSQVRHNRNIYFK